MMWPNSLMRPGQSQQVGKPQLLPLRQNPWIWRTDSSSCSSRIIICRVIFKMSIWRILSNRMSLQRFHLIGMTFISSMNIRKARTRGSVNWSKPSRIWYPNSNTSTMRTWFSALSFNHMPTRFKLRNNRTTFSESHKHSCSIQPTPHTHTLSTKEDPTTLIIQVQLTVCRTHRTERKMAHRKRRNRDFVRFIKNLIKIEKNAIFDIL